MTRSLVSSFEYKKECNEIIDAICGGIGNGEGDVEDKTLKKSSKNALESVLFDQKLGKKVVDNFKAIRQVEQKTYSQLAQDEGDNEFKQRVNDVRELLQENSRKLKHKDLVDPRVVSKSQIGATLFAISVSPLVAAAGTAEVVMHPQVIYNSLNNLYKERSIEVGNEDNPHEIKNNGVMGAISAWTGSITPEYIKENNLEIKKGSKGNRNVTKVSGNNIVKGLSDGLSEKNRSFLKRYENLGLKYKDALFEKLTGDITENYKESVKKLENRVESYVNSLANAEKKLDNIDNSKKELAVGDISHNITSFLVGDYGEGYTAKVTNCKNNLSRFA